MSSISSAEKARQSRRLRSPGFLKSLGVERTTAVMIGAVAGLIFAFVTILTTEPPTAEKTNEAVLESVFEAAEAKALAPSR
jgi:hypothetical protein